MDLNTVAGYRFARSREDLALAPGERVLGGGTWLFSEPQAETTGLVDLSTMGWPAFEGLRDGGLRIGATATIQEVAAHPHPLFGPCAHALLAGWKIWHLATFGGNVCRSFAAGAMVSLSVALDGEAVVWTPDGGEYRLPVAEFVTGNGTNVLGPGEVLRAVDLPGHALRARSAMRKIALAQLGRSGAVLTGRVDEDDRAVFTITAATWAPTVLRYDRVPDAPELRDAVQAAEGYYTDPLGAADWRRGVSAVLLEEIRGELAA